MQLKPQTKFVLSERSPIWQASVRFHGHACPGLAIGCRLALAAVYALDLEQFLRSDGDALLSSAISPDEELVCVSETDACCVDAIQLLLSCTMGKGNLLLKLRGKTAVSFYYRPAQKAVRIIWIADFGKNDISSLTREEKTAYFLSAPEEELLSICQIPFSPPARAAISRSYICSNCHENTAEYAIRLKDGLPYCLECWPTLSRIL